MNGALLTVSLLGRVQVHRRGEPVRVPAGRPTVILAALALRVGAVVPLDVLTGYLWPADQPQRPRATIQTHVARLRAALGEDVIRSAGHGYRLDLPPESVDVTRFRTTVATAALDEDPATCLERFEEALALWHGAPLSGLTPDTLEQETAPLLVEELLATTERANDLRLELSRLDGDFVASLRRLVAAHPWRERLWAQLMLALFRQDRRGEALSAYHELVTTLRDELGIDPGPELTGLHQRLLASDEETPPGTPSEPPSVRPLQLPRPPSRVVGRDREIELVMSTLSGTRPWAPVAVVTGPGGFGKTTLALHVGHLLRDVHPDGQLFVQLRGSSAPVDPADVLAEFLRALGVDGNAIPPTLDERAALFRSLCARRRLLVVLDDAADSAHITPLMPGAAGCGVLVTSRPRLSVVPADANVDLDTLDEEDAYEVLAAVADPEHLKSEPDAVSAVLAACQGSPLALTIAGGRLASRPSWPISHLADRLRGDGRLDELEIGGLSVRATLDASFQALEPALADRFRMLAAMPGSAADVEAASVTWDTDHASARASLERLVDIRLLDSEVPDGYSWHDLVDGYVRELASPTSCAAARRRLTQYYLRTLHDAWPLFRPGGVSTENAAWFPHDVVGRGFGDRDEVHAWLHPHWGFLAALGRAGLRDHQQDVVDESAALMLAMLRTGYECCRDTRVGDAARAVLDIPKELGDRTLTARAWHGLALALGAQRRRREALEAGSRGLAVRRELGDRYGEVIMLHNMAVWYVLDRRFSEAAEMFEQCVAADDVLSPELRVRCLRNLADVQISLGRYDDARRNLEQTAASVEDDGSVEAYDQISAMAHLHRCTREELRAVDGYERAAALAEALDSPSLRATALAYAAHARRLAGLEAGDQAAEAVRIARDDHITDIEAEALVELGHDCARRGDRTGAQRHWRAALEIFTSLHAPEAEDVRELLSATG